MDNLEALKDEINQHYRMLELSFFVDKIIYPLLDTNPDLYEEFGTAKSLLVDTKNRKKDKFAMLLAVTFWNKKLFSALLTRLRGDVRNLLERLLYDEQHVSVVQLSDAYTNTSVIELTLKDRWDYGGIRPLQPEYMIFALTQPESVWLPNNKRDIDFMLYLPDEVRTCLRRYFPAKAEYTQLMAYQGLPEAKYHHSNEATIVEGASQLMNYLEQGLVEYDSKGEKPLKGSLKKIQQMCGFQEFFGIGKNPHEKVMKGADYLLTELLFNLARNQNSDNINFKPDEREDLAIIRYWFEGLCGKPYIFFSPLKHILTHLKMSYHPYEQYKEIFLGAEFFMLLSDISGVGEWISADNLVKKALLEPKAFRLLSFDDAKKFFYVSPSRPSDKRYGSLDKRSIRHESDYRRYISEPLVKGVVFLFAAMGLVEIVYDDALSTTPLNETQYISPFDSLKAVRITKLGNYMLGRGGEYVAPKLSAAAAQKGKLILDEYRLLATLTGANPLLETILSDFMRPLGKAGAEKSKASMLENSELGSRMYVMDSASFLKNCSSGEDVAGKIQLFRKRIAPDVPAIWEKFFEEVLAKIEPLEEQFVYRVFSIKPSRDLMRLISTDVMLKDLVIRAEGYRILIKEDDIPSIRKRLEKFGYVTGLEKRRILITDRHGNS